MRSFKNFFPLVSSCSLQNFTSACQEHKIASRRAAVNSDHLTSRYFGMRHTVSPSFSPTSSKSLLHFAEAWKNAAIPDNLFTKLSISGTLLHKSLYAFAVECTAQTDLRRGKLTSTFSLSSSKSFQSPLQCLVFLLSSFVHRQLTTLRTLSKPTVSLAHGSVTWPIPMNFRSLYHVQKHVFMIFLCLVHTCITIKRCSNARINFLLNSKQISRHYGL